MQFVSQILTSWLSAKSEEERICLLVSEQSLADITPADRSDSANSDLAAEAARLIEAWDTDGRDGLTKEDFTPLGWESLKQMIFLHWVGKIFPPHCAN